MSEEPSLPVSPIMETTKLGFWRSVFSEADGTGSWSRLSGGFTLLAALTWVSFVTWHTKAIPSLDGISLFIGAGSASYAVNKISAAVSKP